MTKHEAHIVLNQVREGVLIPEAVVLNALVITGDIHGKLDSPDSSADSRRIGSLSPTVHHAAVQDVE